MFCTRCQTEKNETEFSPSRVKQASKSGHAWCRKCCVAHNKPTKEYLKEWHRQKHYGIGNEDYDRILEAQGGTCALCDAQYGTSDLRRSLHVDHDHKTGKVRGLLCFNCNRNIVGLENKVWMARAVAYLV